MSSKSKRSERNCVAEWSFSSKKHYADPFNEVEVSAVFTDPNGEERLIPAFWAGGGVWRVRYASDMLREHRFRTVCSDKSNAGLHGQEGSLEVVPYSGHNSLLKHGPLRVSNDRRYLEHVDGTPFFWLGDTWWKGLCKRIDWQGFQTLAADRVAKGFTVIQIVAGLYPDEPPFDKRGENEGGWCWEKDYARINPKYFDYADRRIQNLVDAGLLPCIVGCWGYYLPWMGLEKMKKHWRYLVARYGAHPVVWCLAGEWTMQYYVRQDLPAGTVGQEQGWVEIAKYVKSIDPYHHPMTLHEGTSARRVVKDPYLLDFDMPQTGHAELNFAAPNTIGTVSSLRSMNPPKPVLVGEVVYEGHQHQSYHPVQRYIFWVCILNGACGHTYGAGGIWQMNAPGEPHGPSPHGGTYEDIPWNEAMNLEGSRHLGISKKLIARYPWWRFEPHQDWVEPAGKSFTEPHDRWFDPLARWNKEDGNYMLPYAAGIPGEVRLIYIPRRSYNWTAPKVKKLEKDTVYRAFYFNPATGKEYDLGSVPREASQSGSWQAPNVPLAQDWVLVLEKVR